MYCYKESKNAHEVYIALDGQTGIKAIDAQIKKYSKAFDFSVQAGKLMILPSAAGILQHIIAIPAQPNITDWAKLAGKLVNNISATNHAYHIMNWELLDDAMRHQLVLAWGLSHYNYQKFKSDKGKAAGIKKAPQLLIASKDESAEKMAHAINWGRDLINHPSNYLNPSRLSAEMAKLAQQQMAKFTVTDGAMLKKHYPLVAEVGKAGADKPRMLELRWTPPKGKAKIKLALIGKGVCFDSGGLDLKPSKGMLLMKKDMGGAAHALVLARLIMEQNLPIDLRLLIPAVENMVAENAMRPMDILNSRHGLTVEIGNTDAEGRLILADALTAASEEAPDMIIDYATLTGAARVATGTDLPNLFSNRDHLLSAIKLHSDSMQDYLWPMPLFEDYKKHLQSENADLTNAPAYGYAGSITAALFLQEFLISPIPWIHLDVMGFNLSALPGKPRGGEIQGVRTIFQFLQDIIKKGVTIDEYENTARSIRT